MKSTLLIFLILNFPFWAYGQNNEINSNIDTIHNSLSSAKREASIGKTEVKKSFSKKIHWFQNRFRFKKSDSIVNIKPKNTFSSTKENYLGADTNLKVKSNTIFKSKKKNTSSFSDSLEQKRDSLVSKSRKKNKKGVFKFKNKFSKNNLDSNQYKSKGFSSHNKTKSRDLFNFKKEQFSELDTNLKSKSKDAVNLKKDKSRLLSDSTKPNKDSLYSKSKSVKEKYQSGLKDKFSNTDLVSFQGSVLLESYYSTIPVPFSALTQNYQRITLDGTVKVFGLPLKTEGYYTTDKSGYYPSNMFRVYFDAETMKEDALNNGKKIKETEEGKLKSKLNETKEKKEADLKNTLAFQNYYTNRKSYFEKNLNTQFKGLKLPKNDSLNNLLNKPDFSIEDKLQKFDSLKKIRLDLNLPDTSALRKYLTCKMEVDRLDSCKIGVNNKYKSIKDKWNLDSLTLISQIENSKNKLSGAKKLRSSFSPSQLAGSIKAFQIGIINTKFSDLSVSGISVKGFGTTIGSKLWSLEVFKGKTYTVKNTLKQGPVYDLPVFGFQIKTEINKNEFYVHNTSFEESAPNNFSKSKTLIFGAGSNFNLLKNNLNGTAEVALSHSKKYINIPVQTVISPENNPASLFNGTFSVFKNIAFKGSLNYTNDRLGSFKVMYRNIQPAFDNSLVPFLRKDFAETQLQWQKKYFKNKLTLKGSYKYLSDNLQNIKPNTNKIRGFGFEAKGQFKNGLSLSFLYQPYDLSNNNPDTLYRTRNKFSIIQSTIMYIVNSKKMLSVFSLMGMRSKTNYAGVVSQTYTVNGMANLSFNDKYLLEINSGTNFIPDNEDSLNYYSAGLNAGLKSKLFKGVDVSIMSQTSTIIYKSGGYLIQTGLTLNSKIKTGTTFGITGLMGINKINTYQTNPDFYTIKISVKHPLNYRIKKSDFKRNIKPIIKS